MDYLFRGIAREGRARVLGIDALNSIREICDSHKTLPLSTIAFARFLLAGALIGVLEKDSNGIMMQINSDGTIKSMFMQATPDGRIRGYVGDNKGELDLKEEDLKIENVVGRNGILSVTKVFDKEHTFTSDVILTASDISKDIAYYFFTSEQIPTIINLQILLDEEGLVKSAKGYLIQLLTGYDEEDLKYLESLDLESISDVEKNITKMFNDFQKLETIQIKNVCDCSKERFKNSLLTLPLDDLKDLANEQIEIVCEFCAKKYLFSKEELEELIKLKTNQ